jgi:outer membrane protein OmpA-like peptidoglycan-associated protein
MLTFHTKVKTSLLFIVFIASMLFTSCNGWKAMLKKGDKKFDRAEFEFAIQFYQKALTKGGPKDIVNYKIANSYRISNRIKEASPYYKSAIDAGNKKDSAIFFLALGLKSKGEYVNAQSLFKQYLGVGLNNELKRRSKVEIENIDKIKELLLREQVFKVKNATYLNTEGSEFCPVCREDKIIFTSSRGQSKLYKANGLGFTDIFQFKPDGAFQGSGVIKQFVEKFNNEATHEACITFSVDGNTIVFARSNDGTKKGAANTDLFISHFRAGEWSEPELLNISDPDAWDSSPAFSSDGKTLYFASNRKGGKGGVDIWKSTLDNKGKFHNVTNLGGVINTPANDMFPYASPDGRLYFSSVGHVGLGGLDIFVAYRDDSTFKIVIENLGPPINSSGDDFAFQFKNSTFGYFSSNRDGGKGDDDIYEFVDATPATKVANYTLVGTIIKEEEEGKDEEPIASAHVQLLDDKGVKLLDTITGPDGKFKKRIEVEKNYTIIAEKDGFFTERELYSTIGKTIPQSALKRFYNEITFETVIELSEIVINKEIVLENIYYDYNKSDIRPDAAEELDKLVQIMKDNPKISIELGSHTDSRGNDDYNMALSQSRAEAAVNYIVSKGISPDRLSARGYGETNPIIPTASQEKEYQVNRRTEFKVISVN